MEKVSVYKRKSDGKWVASINLGMSPAGKTQRKNVYGRTKADALAKATEEYKRIEAGEAKVVTGLTLGGYLEAWLQKRRAYSENEWASKAVGEWTGLRRKTLMSYEGTFKYHVKPFEIAQVKMAKLTRLLVNGHYRALRSDEKPRSERIVKLTHVLLHKALKDAVRDEILVANPAADAWFSDESAERKRKRKVKVELWDADQVRQFIKACHNDRLGSLYVLALMTGLRQGELLGLTWEKVDLEKGTLLVDRQLEEANGKGVVGERVRVTDVKSDNSNRHVHLDPVSLQALVAHREKMRFEAATHSRLLSKETPVFCNTIGTWLRRGNMYQRSFQKVMDAAELPHIRFHDLRHLHATLLDEVGVGAKTVSSRLGHSQISLTMDRYTHARAKADKEAANLLAEFLFSESA